MAGRVGAVLVLPRVLGSCLLYSSGEVCLPAVLRHVLVFSSYALYRLVWEDAGKGQRFDDVVKAVLRLAEILLFGSYFLAIPRRRCLASFAARLTPAGPSPWWPTLLGLAGLGAATVTYLLNQPRGGLDLSDVVLLYRGFLILSHVEECSGLLHLLGNCFLSLDRRLSRAREVRPLLLEFDSLRQAAADVSLLYSVQNLFTIGLSFFMCTICAFFILKEQGFGNIVQSFLWMSVYFWFSYRIISAASYLTEKADNFDIHVYEKLKKDPEPGNCGLDLDDLFCDRSVKITAADYFDLKMEHLGSMIAAGTTYVVMLLQMMPAQN